MENPQAMSRQLIHRIAQAIAENEAHRQIVDEAEIVEQDRQFVRAKLIEAAEHIRKSYDLEIPVIRSFLHEMVDVSI